MARCSECAHAVREADGHWCAKLNLYSLNGDHEISCDHFAKQETDIISQIGTPAALEQLAEECCELGQAAMKLARKLRGENPTPKTLEDCTSAVQEEMADVLVCMGVLGETGMFGGIDGIDKIADEKQQRWQKRLSEVKP